jgi:hypothetical protein
VLSGVSLGFGSCVHLSVVKEEDETHRTVQSDEEKIQGKSQ